MVLRRRRTRDRPRLRRHRRARLAGRPAGRQARRGTACCEPSIRSTTGGDDPWTLEAREPRRRRHLPHRRAAGRDRRARRDDEGAVHPPGQPGRPVAEGDRRHPSRRTRGPCTDVALDQGRRRRRRRGSGCGRRAGDQRRAVVPRRRTAATSRRCRPPARSTAPRGDRCAATRPRPSTSSTTRGKSTLPALFRVDATASPPRRRGRCRACRRHGRAARASTTSASRSTPPPRPTSCSAAAPSTCSTRPGNTPGATGRSSGGR